MVAALAVAAVAITGTAQEGQKLSAPPAAAPATYQWYRCAPDASHCVSIHGAKAGGYRLGIKDVGKAIALTMKAADGTPTYVPAVGPVASKAAKLAATVQPTITGDRTLTVDNGSWSATPSGYTYAWLRCNANGRICVAVGGATHATYTPTADDVGHALAVRITATAGSTAQSALSVVTPPIVAPSGPVPSADPSMTGTAKQGQRLAALPGTWTGSGAVTFAYQWYRCDARVAHCVSIHGATAAGYTLGARDVGKTLALTVTATDAVASVSKFVSAVGPVGADTATLVSTVQPKLTAAGAKLTTDNGAWSLGAASFTYQWLRCNLNGRACTPIAGATHQTYTRTADDTAHALVAVVTTGGASALSRRA